MYLTIEKSNEMYRILLLLFFIPAFGNGQQDQYEKYINSIEVNIDTAMNNNKIMAKVFKKLAKSENLETIKKKVKYEKRRLEENITKYVKIYEESLMLYNLSNKNLITLESKWGDHAEEKEVQMLEELHNEIEEYSTELNVRAEENKDQTALILDLMQHIEKSNYLQDVQEYAYEIWLYLQENKTVLKTMKPYLKRSKKSGKKAFSFQ